MTDRDKRLDRGRQTLEGGADPTVVATWIRDVQAERLRAQHEVASASPIAPLTLDDARALVSSLDRELVNVLESADPDAGTGLCSVIGANLTYQPAARTVAVEVAAFSRVYQGACRRGDYSSTYTAPTLSAVLTLG